LRALLRPEAAHLQAPSSPRSSLARPQALPRDLDGKGNDCTARDAIWRRYQGDDWAAFDALPPAVRRRLQEHAYDAWSVNALMLWRGFRRKLACSATAERRLLRYLDTCEALECAAFAETYRASCGNTLPHLEARASVLRYSGGGSGVERACARPDRKIVFCGATIGTP